MIGYDGSDAARRALERAARLARPSRTVLVVTVAPLLYPTRRAGDILDPAEADEARRLLEDARDELARCGVRVETHGTVGDTADAIIEAARASDAHLVVVGTRGRNTAVRVLLGSVSSKVVQGAPCDVLVVR